MSGIRIINVVNFLQYLCYCVFAFVVDIRTHWPSIKLGFEIWNPR